MVNMLAGKHLIAGEWRGSEVTFRSDPYRGIGREFPQGSATDVDDAARQATLAFESFAYTDMTIRSNFLNNIAAGIDVRQSDIIKICCEETGLPEGRISGEFTRTVNQLRYFANYILTREHFDLRHDSALPARQPIPRPDLKMVQRPVGPVAVFGASNFPLAFSTAGGDTAAALAAGCPVIVKGHSAHAATADLVAQCISQALQNTGLPSGVFSQIHSSSVEAGQALVLHPLVKAVGFTGSLTGGRILFDMCASRPVPIPFYGELGSINPVFILPHALSTHAERLAREWITSLTFGAGQLCTNPGLLIVLASENTEKFIDLLTREIHATGEQVMLSDSITRSFKKGHDGIRDCADTVLLKQSECTRRSVTPGLYRCTAQAWLSNPHLADEVFGPLGQIVVAQSIDEVLALARALEGQLTCSIHLEENDNTMAAQLLPIVEHKAGRIIANGFPTGVEVCDAMVHGGPYPASTNFGATSVGSLSMRRFLRPVCYQNLPDSLYNTVAKSGAVTSETSTDHQHVALDKPEPDTWYQADSKARAPID